MRVSIERGVGYEDAMLRLSILESKARGGWATPKARAIRKERLLRAAAEAAAERTALLERTASVAGAAVTEAAIDTGEVAEPVLPADAVTAETAMASTELGDSRAVTNLGV